MMVRAKELHFDDQSKQVVFSFSLQCFLKEKEKEKISSLFPSSYRNTTESLGEQKMIWE